MRRSLLVMIALACRAAASSAPDPKQIVRLSVQAIQADWAQAPGYSFEERDVETKHRGRATIKTVVVLMMDGSSYRRVVAINDHPLASGDQAEEQRKLRVEIRKQARESNYERSRRIAKYEKERHDQAMLLAMLDAFDFKLLDAHPRPNYQPEDRETKVLAGMRGRLWIDNIQDQWVRVKAEVFKPVSFYGFVAKVGPGTRILLEQEPTTDNLWLPKRFSMDVSASAFRFFDESSTDDETYRDGSECGVSSLPEPRP